MNWELLQLLLRDALSAIWVFYPTSMWQWRMAGSYTILPPRPSYGNDDKTIEYLRDEQLKWRRKCCCIGGNSGSEQGEPMEDIKI
ncbi:MAG: hypothetical protein LUQ38_12685, partial [Methanotrichaceae archaeon]|nr:hypothetical protein [Methanotrichaceae archaeon]